MKINQKVKKLLEIIPPSELPEFCKKNKYELGEIASELEYLSIYAAQVSAYIGMRHGNGCGDQGHASAEKKSCKSSQRGS